MAKIYFNKIQNTSDSTITKFYYNESDANYNNLNFLKNKIKSLLQSQKTSDSVKKQLKKLVNFDFNKYNCFYIYSNMFCFGIDSKNKTIDFYKNDFDSVIDLQGYTKNYNCKIKSQNQSDSDIIDESDFQ